MSIILRQDELNLLIYKYLLEAGFSHAAYTLYYEANVDAVAKTYGADVKAGHLLTHLERSLIYQNIENHVNLSEFVECKEPMCLVKPHICSMVEKKRKEILNEDNIKEQIILDAMQRTDTMNKVSASAQNANNFDYTESQLLDNVYKVPSSDFTARYFSSCWNAARKILTVHEQSKNYIKNIFFQNDTESDTTVFETESMLPCCVGDSFLGVFYMEWDKQTHNYLLVVYTNGCAQLTDAQNRPQQLFKIENMDQISSIQWNPSWNNCLAIVLQDKIDVIDPFTGQRLLFVELPQIVQFQWRYFDQYLYLDAQNVVRVCSLEQSDAILTFQTDPLTNDILVNQSKTMVATVCQQESSIKIWTFNSTEHVLHLLDDNPLLYYGWCYNNLDGVGNMFVTVTENSIKLWDIEFGQKKYTANLKEPIKEFFILEGISGSMLLAFCNSSLQVIDVRTQAKYQFPLTEYPKKLIKINNQTVIAYTKDYVLFIDFKKYVP